MSFLQSSIYNFTCQIFNLLIYSTSETIFENESSGWRFVAVFPSLCPSVRLYSTEDSRNWYSWGGKIYKKNRLLFLAPQGVLGSPWKCQKSKVRKISDRHGMSKKFSTPTKNIFFVDKKSNWQKICDLMVFW